MFHNPLLQQAIAANLQQQNSLLLGGGYMVGTRYAPFTSSWSTVCQAFSCVKYIVSCEVKFLKEITLFKAIEIIQKTHIFYGYELCRYNYVTLI